MKEGLAVRLKPDEIACLLELVRTLDANGRLYLYGSRTDLQARGGDIDLVLESESISSSDLWRIRRPFCERFGEQKIDILLHDPREEPGAFLRYIKDRLVELTV